MEYGIIKKEIQGKFKNYTELRAEQGYCFYDVDETDDARIYLNYILTPITDELELSRKFKVVYGNADELNEQLEKNNIEKE